MPIAHASLFLNPDGSIYHLNLLPGELAPTIILVGDPDRAALVSKHFDHIEVRKQKREFVTHTGTMGNQRLSVIGTGIGAGNIDVVINEADALFNVDFKTRLVKDTITPLRFIRLGTAGSLQADLPVDSLVISEAGIAFDGLLNYYDRPFSKMELDLKEATLNHFSDFSIMHKPYVAEGSPALIEQFAQHGQRGITLTCNGFYGPQGRVVRAPLAQDNLLEKTQAFEFNTHRALNFEMETATIYGLSKTLGHQSCSISAIVFNRITDTSSANADKTIDDLIQMTLRTLIG